MTKKEVIVPADDLVCLGKDKLQELIRCKDCKYWTKPYGWNGFCDKHRIPAEADDFCSSAERKEE